MRKHLIIALMCAALAGAAHTATGTNRGIRIEAGPFCSSSPYGVTILADRGAAFVISPETDLGRSRISSRDEALLPYPLCAPDGSYATATMTHKGQQFTMTYGIVDTATVAIMLTAVQDMSVTLHWRQPYSGCKTLYWADSNGLQGMGTAANTGATYPLDIRCYPAMSGLSGKYLMETSTVCAVSPARPTVLTVTVGGKPAVRMTAEEAVATLRSAGERYGQNRVRAEGDWGDYAGAIAKTMNASRMFSSLDRRVVHSIGRGWWIAHQSHISGNDDMFALFAWDSFFNACLASLEDPETARETVRAMLSYQLPDGMVPNYAHWPCQRQYVTPHRTNPPIGAMCVWKMHQRQPDMEFLKEVYPKLVRWHDWFRKGRARAGSYLLSWGNGKGSFRDAVLETGWDDTPAFEGGKMEGTLIDQYHVDLCSLWAMDAEYLAMMADALGLKDDAERFRGEHSRMVEEMNDKLWNDRLGMYCHRYWQDNADGSPHFATRITPMNFYPMICGAPDKKKARKMLAYLHNPKKFWGEYLIPTLPYDDPDYPKQEYWRGHIWGPVNYLVWQGVMRYDDARHTGEYARRSVRLFMRNWSTPDGICGENYRSDNGTLGDDPHYTWGALLPLIGIEALADITPDMKPVPRDISLNGNITLRRIPIGGVLYRIESKGGKITVTKEQQ